MSAAAGRTRVYPGGGPPPTLKESLVLLSGCLHMTKPSRRHATKMTVSATMFHAAAPPCTAKTLNARISSPAREPRAWFLRHPGGSRTVNRQNRFK